MSALADHLLGYSIDGVEGIRYGPRPYEGIVSEICEAFGCAPDVAERQSWRLVGAILEYRTARWAVEAFNDKEHGMDTLNRHPQLIEMLNDMQRAQTGETLVGDGDGRKRR